LVAGLRVVGSSPQVPEFPPATTIARGERFECAMASRARKTADTDLFTLDTHMRHIRDILDTLETH